MMDDIVAQALKPLMPKGSILYTARRFPDWEIVAADQAWPIYTATPSYATITLHDGTVYFVPFAAPGRFARPPADTIKSVEFHAIPAALMAQAYKRKQQRQTLHMSMLIIVLIVGYFAPRMIRDYRQRQYQQDMATVRDLMMEKERNEQQLIRQRSEDRRTLNLRVAELTEQIGDVWVLTNATEPVVATLSPNHFAMGLGLAKVAAKVVKDENPAGDFLAHEDKYGYRIMLRMPSDTIAFAQSNITFSDTANSGHKADASGVTVTVATKYTDEEIATQIANHPNIGSRAALEEFYPAMKDGYERRQYRISAAELASGELTFANIRVKNMSFDKPNTTYFISATNANLPMAEQQRLVDKLMTQFNISRQAMAQCCRWQQIKASR
ncbi:hypothetical protein [Shewanella sp.]|uniref:hypothetical protein n=1 Tax=Shewanella sp. TaxID=50422 RepID=UPI003A9737F4